MKKIKLLLLNFLSKVRKSMLGKYAKSILYDTENGLILLPTEDFSIGRKLGFSGKWDVDEINYLKTLINNDSIIYILGTHVGTLVIPLSRECKKIIGFEASPDNFKYIKLNLLINNITNSLIYNKAVGNKYSKISFIQNKVNSGGSKISPKINNYSFTYDSPNVIEIDMVPLDDFRAKNDIPNPDLIIMDIEGSEYFALQGMNDTIKQCKQLYIEFEPNHLRYVADCKLDAFFNLFIDKFNFVFFMKKGKQIELSDKSNFFSIITEMYNKDEPDNLLFIK